MSLSRKEFEDAKKAVSDFVGQPLVHSIVVDPKRVDFKAPQLPDQLTKFDDSLVSLQHAIMMLDTIQHASKDLHRARVGNRTKAGRCVT